MNEFLFCFKLHFVKWQENLEIKKIKLCCNFNDFFTKSAVLINPYLKPNKSFPPPLPSPATEFLFFIYL